MSNAGKPYRPANGSEGEYFMARFCYQCKRDAKFQRTQNGEDSCPILVATMVYDTDDDEYPKEWVTTEAYPLGGAGKCTAFEQVEGGNSEDEQEAAGRSDQGI